MRTDFTGIVLAGGRSSRMGRDKAELPWGRGTLLDRMVESLRDAGAREVVVSGRPGGQGGVADAWPARGPVGGIASVLPRVADGDFVVVPVDLPLLQPAHLLALLDALGTVRATHFEDHPLPFALRLDARVRVAVETVMREHPGGPSVMQMHAALGTTRVPHDFAGNPLRPCNTPADWAGLTV